MGRGGKWSAWGRFGRRRGAICSRLCLVSGLDCARIGGDGRGGEQSACGALRGVAWHLRLTVQ